MWFNLYLRFVEDFEFVDSKVGFFSKITVLWIQA
ncbi:unnamed protein product [Spirodela intermedia]|uniref:Uncharacterized protein n=1 Tax=Spirodela intermedia TaxID=51605 RepID=A0A7I8KAQ6_SPIIN|nr:unnamed protein product [Spirodela intermedia]